MSLCRKEGSGRVLCTGLWVMLALFLLLASALAQQEATPKVDIFVGYQWLHPGGNVPAPFQSPINPVAFKLPDMSDGAGASFTYNFDQHWGLEADYGINWNDVVRESTASVGPRFTWRTEGVNFFAHTLLGLNRLSVNHVDSNNGIGAVLGGGIDIPVWRPLSIRLIEADYVLGRHNFAREVSPAFPDLQRPVLSGARLRTGLVFNFGYPSAAVPAASCSVQPSEVMVGEPVTATASGSNFNPKHTLTYTWSSTGGKVTSKDATATIDTNGVPGGSYTVTARITDPKMKKGGEASCTANFAVKEPPKNPPTMSCSANPTTVQTGATSTLSCSCTSPDNVPVTVSTWTASGGSVSGSGATATLATAGASAGPITVSATCTDSRGLTTSTSTQVTVEAPPPQVSPLEARLALHSIYFPTAQPTVQNPSGGLVASQQQTLIVLASDFLKYLETKPDAHLILEGHADPRGSAAYNQALSERRVDRTKRFLMERGIPAANIETKAFGHQRNLAAAEVKDSVEKNPELTPEERQRVLKNMRTIILAANRRVDITLSTTGQASVRQYPFNAADSLTLIGGRSPETKKTTGPAAKKRPKKKE